MTPPDASGLTSDENALAGQVARSAAADSHDTIVDLRRRLIARLGPEAAFPLWRRAVTSKVFPDADWIDPVPLMPLRAGAVQSPVHIDVAKGGLPFAVHPPRVLGVGDHRILHGTSRDLFLTRIDDARVRSTSGVIAVAGRAYMDFERGELSEAGEQLDYDPGLFAADTIAMRACVLGADTGLRLDEAFTLMGSHANNFGHWIHEYLPRYMMALTTGELPPAPILVNALMPASHLQALRFLVPPGVAIVERPWFTLTHVRQLWTSACPCYPTTFPTVPDWNVYCHDSVVYASILAEMTRRFDAIIPPGSGPDKVYLARRPGKKKQLINAAQIERIAREEGFSIVYPEDLDFASQFHLIRNARFVLGPEGSALVLCFFSPLGTRVGILHNTHTEPGVILADLLSQMGIDVTLLSGPIFKPSRYLFHSDYEIDSVRFQRFLPAWLAGEREFDLDG